MEREISKIILVGLDYAGKTSIVTALRREFDQIALLKPTRGAQRTSFEYLGNEITEWDLGGQDSYRATYLKSPAKYFDQTRACIYVIDIQDPKRFKESLAYFKSILGEFQNLNQQPRLFIFFHKLDRKYVKANKEEVELTVQKLKKNLQAEIPGEFDTKFYETTIKQPHTVFSAFSELMLALFPRDQLMETSLIQFGEQLKCKGLALLDANGLIISKYFIAKHIEFLVQATIPSLLTLSENMCFELNESPNQECLNPELEFIKENRISLNQSDNSFLFDQFYVEKYESPLYLLVVQGDRPPEDNEIDAFLKVIKNYL